MAIGGSGRCLPARLWCWACSAAVQLKMEHPLVEVRTFAFPGFTLGMLILLMSSGGVLGVNFLLPILLQRGLGHTA